MEDFFEEKQNGAETAESVDIGRYFRGILKRWWLVLGTFLLVGVPWTLYVQKQPPMYEAEAWINFENVTGNIPANLIDSRIRKLRSRRFAEEVTAELGLCVRIIQESGQPRLEREDVFRHLSTSRDVVPGIYSLRFYASGFASIYFDKGMLDSMQVDRMIGDTLAFNGIQMALNPDIVWNRSRVRLTASPFMSVAKSLQSRLNITVNRIGNAMKITLIDPNPMLASQTVNMLAGIFVDKSKEMQKETNRFIRDYLKEQRDMVQRELNESDYALKRFRENYVVGLDQETQTTVSQLDAIQAEINRLGLQKNEMNMLLSKLDPTEPGFNQGVSVHYIYRQMANQPVFNNDADMIVTRQQLRDLDQEREGLRQTLPETNPTIVEVSHQIATLENKIYSLAKKKISDIDDQIRQFQSRMQEQQARLEMLPEEELRFIKLTRDRNAKEEIFTMLNRRYIEAQISEEVSTENVSILDTSLPPDYPIGGDKKQKALMGLAGGLLLGVLLALFWEMADRSVKTQDDVRRYLKLPILGIIPKVKFDAYEMQDSEKAKSISSQIVTHDYSPTPVGEAYRSLRTSLLFSKRLGPVQSMVISSVFPGEGKSFTAANLAITMAQQKSKTLLIDADLRRGVLHNSFNCSKKPGLTNYLTGVVSLEKVLNETYVPNLYLITCGSMIPNPSELLGSVKMKRFIEGITKRFDFVIFDSPPLVAATDAVVLGTLVNGVGMLIRAGKTNRQDVTRKLELFHNVQATVIGVILNGAGIEIAHEGYSYYSY